MKKKERKKEVLHPNNSFPECGKISQQNMDDFRQIFARRFNSNLHLQKN